MMIASRYRAAESNVTNFAPSNFLEAGISSVFVLHTRVDVRAFRVPDSPKVAGLQTGNPCEKARKRRTFA